MTLNYIAANVQNSASFFIRKIYAPTLFNGDGFYGAADHGFCISVLKLDHLGDVMMATPALAVLTKAGFRIRLGVGPWSKSLAPLLLRTGIVDSVDVLQAPWLNRPFSCRKAVIGAIDAERAILNWANKSWVIDLREYFPLNTCLGLNSARWRAGFYSGKNSRFSPFNLSLNPLQCNSAGDACLALVCSFLKSVPLAYSAPVKLKAFYDQRSVAVSGSYICLCFDSRDPRRELSFDQMVATIEAVKSLSVKVVLIGGPLVNQSEFVDASVVDLRGRTSMDDLFLMIQGSCGVVSVDSFVSHIALSFDRLCAVVTPGEYINRRSFPFLFNRHVDFSKSNACRLLLDLISTNFSPP